MIDYKNAAQMRELMERVTPGPWEVSEDTNEAWGRTDKELYVKPVFYGSYSKYDQASRYYEGPDLWDAQFIALSREALPYWIERATQAERAVERLADLLANEELCPQECENTAIGPDTAEDERVQICRECWLTRAMGGTSNVG